MAKDKTKIYLTELLLVLIFMTCTFFRFTKNNYFTVILLTISLVLINILFPRKQQHKKNKNILYTMIVFGFIYLISFYILGLYSSFYKSNISGLNAIINYLIPITIIIILTEKIRNKLLINDSKLSRILLIIFGTIIDTSLYLEMFSLKSLDNFLGIIGFLIIAGISNNILYTYVNKKYGETPVIAYKLITNLYLYIMPIIPDVYLYLRTFLKMFYPLIIYTHLEQVYGDIIPEERPKNRKKQIISSIIDMVIVILIISLISCKFTYGLLVIGSGSMTNTINKGDIILYKNDKKNISEGDIIVFKKDNLKIVHRVIKIKNINDEFRYYTKGDANQTKDEGYIKNSAIEGKVLFTIRYLGNPTLWLRELFDKEG